MERIQCYDADGNFVDSLVQWDQGQVVYIDNLESGGVPNVHFAFSGNNTSWEFSNITSLSNNYIKVNIPNEVMKQSGTLHLFFVYGNGTTYTTKYKAIITIKAKPKPDDYVSNDDGTTVSLAQLRTDINSLENTKITAPTSGEVNYVLVVSSVDKSGKPTAWKAVDINTLIK